MVGAKRPSVRQWKSNGRSFASAGQPINSTTLRDSNRARVLSTIARGAPLSRAQIARSTGLTPVAVGAIVAGLEREGYLRESNASLTGPAGRRSILLELNGSRAYVIGVNLGITHVTAVQLDLAGKVHRRYAEPIGATDEQALLGYLERAVCDATNDAPTDATVLGVGIGLHGLVDADAGAWRFAPHFGLKNWPVREHLETRLQLPVIIENGVRAMTLGEHWFGAARDVQTFACVAVGAGIGAGIMLEGRLYRGELGIAGEVGHTTIDVNGPRCACGNFGCLETLASGEAIARRAQSLLKQGRASLISQLTSDLEHVTAETVGLAAAQGDVLASQVLSEAGVFLGVAVANLADLFGLRFILIGGGVARAGERLLQVVRETAAQKVLDHPDTKLEIVPATLGDGAGSLGAAALVLEHFFSAGGARA